jgi:FdhD protein
MDAIHDALIIRLTGDRFEELVDPVAVEAPFTLLVNGEILVSLLCTPTELDALALGFLLSEGLLANREMFGAVEVDEKKSTVAVHVKDLPHDWTSRFYRKTITSGCGKGITFTDARRLPAGGDAVKDFKVTAPVLRGVLQQFKESSSLFLKTGGVHSAALAGNTGDMLYFSEDIGRHNAVDKLIGKAFLAEIPLQDKILFTSGRVSGEIMTKVVRSGIPVLVSRAAPTCMSIASAEDHGVTLIGFARGQRMNIYTHPGRILSTA